MRHYEEEVLAHTTSPVQVTRIDVPFLDLLWLFLKSSLAMALAMALTGWLWVILATAFASLLAATLWLIGVPKLIAAPPRPEPAAIAAPMPAPMPMPLPPPPPPVEPPTSNTAAVAPAPEPAAPPAPSDPNHAATEALQRQELERHRQQSR